MIKNLLLACVIVGILVTPTTRADVFHLVQDLASLVLHITQVILSPLTA